MNSPTSDEKKANDDAATILFSEYTCKKIFAAVFIRTDCKIVQQRPKLLELESFGFKKINTVKRNRPFVCLYGGNTRPTFYDGYDKLRIFI